MFESPEHISQLLDLDEAGVLVVEGGEGVLEEEDTGFRDKVCHDESRTAVPTNL